MKDKAQQVSVSLFSKDRALVEIYMEEAGITSFSQALRLIIRQWHMGRQPMIPKDYQDQYESVP